MWLTRVLTPYLRPVNISDHACSATSEMTMAIDVLYELSGVANGAPLLITGTGEVDPVAGTYDLDIVSSISPWVGTQQPLS